MPGYWTSKAFIFNIFMDYPNQFVYNWYCIFMKQDSKKKNLITQEGYDRLVKELEERKKILRNEIAEKIESARKDGDLSENAAYTVAMEEKAANDSRIMELEGILATSEIISGTDNGFVNIGSTVEVLVNGSTKQQFIFVGIQESDPARGLISDQSPLGKAMMGRKRGDTVSLLLPNGNENKYEILSVS